MAKMNKVIKYLGGFVFNQNGDEVKTQTEAWKKEADCGCGIDCCDNKLVLTDKTNGEKVDLQFEGGALIIVTEDGTKYSATLTAL